MLFQAVMKYLSRLVEFKILVNWGIVHYYGAKTDKGQMKYLPKFSNTVCTFEYLRDSVCVPLWSVDIDHLCKGNRRIIPSILLKVTAIKVQYGTNQEHAFISNIAVGLKVLTGNQTLCI